MQHGLSHTATDFRLGLLESRLCGRGIAAGNGVMNPANSRTNARDAIAVNDPTAFVTADLFVDRQAVILVLAFHGCFVTEGKKMMRVRRISKDPEG